MTEDCIFCKIVNGEIPVEPIYEDDKFIGILDNQPKMKGHALLITKDHFKSILDMPNTIGNELLEAMKKLTLQTIGNEKCDGFNIHLNGIDNMVDHVHFHILPRNKDDGFNPCV